MIKKNLLVAGIIVVAAFLIAIQVPSITGLFLGSGEYPLNEVFTENQERVLVITAEDYATLKSVKITGNFSGEGNVNIYLVDEDKQFLIADKNALMKQGEKEVEPPSQQPPENETPPENITPPTNETPPENITPAINETPPNETPTEIPNQESPTGNIIGEGQGAVVYNFGNVCVETCDLPSDFNKSSYLIKFEITQSALYVDKITYEYVPKPPTIIPNLTTETKENVTEVNVSKLKKNKLLNPSFEKVRPTEIPENWYSKFDQERGEYDQVEWKDSLMNDRNLGEKSLMFKYNKNDQEFVYSNVFDVNYSDPLYLEFYFKPGNLENSYAYVWLDLFDNSNNFYIPDCKGGVYTGGYGSLYFDGNGAFNRIEDECKWSNIQFEPQKNGWIKVSAIYTEIPSNAVAGRIALYFSDKQNTETWNNNWYVVDDTFVG
jgi:hypothetical protein